jgi:hypothetical protein
MIDSKDNFLNPLNPYRVKEGKMPFKIYADEHPEDDPVMDARRARCRSRSTRTSTRKTTRSWTFQNVNLRTQPFT